jgi:hypothetical protein
VFQVIFYQWVSFEELLEQLLRITDAHDLLQNAGPSSVQAISAPHAQAASIDAFVAFIWARPDMPSAAVGGLPDTKANISATCLHILQPPWCVNKHQSGRSSS